MQTLTSEEVKKNAREYYDKGLLTAQHPNPEFRVCRNQIDDKYRCAVAASYNDETLKHTFAQVEEGILRGLLEVKHPMELAKIARIQTLHDLWATASKKGLDEGAKFLENQFYWFITI